MPDKIEARIEPSVFLVTAGDSLEAAVSLRNLGQTVDQFSVAVEGLPAEWYTLPVASVALFPNDNDKLKLIIHPPAGDSLKSGAYPFKVNISSQETPPQVSSLDLKLDVRVAAEEKINVVQIEKVPWYRPLLRIPLIIIRWLERKPVIQKFEAVTEDKHTFTLSWSVKRAREITLDGEKIEKQGEIRVTPGTTTTYVLDAKKRYKTASKSVEVKPLAVPVARSSERIGTSLSPNRLQSERASVPAIASLSLQNMGSTVDKFSLAIEGVDSTWYRLSAASVALMPQAKEQVQITFQPPRKKGVRAGNYPFGVMVRSQSAAQDYASILGELEIMPDADFKVSIHPFRVTTRNKGEFRVKLSNTSVSDLKFSLEATDLDEGLDFRFKNNNTDVAAWKTIEVPMIARLKKGKPIGQNKRYDITLTATAGEKTQTANCELTHAPTISSWRIIFKVIRAVVVIGAVVALIFFLLKWGGGWSILKSSPQTWAENLVNTFQGWFGH